MNCRACRRSRVAACGFAHRLARLRAKPQAATILILLACTRSGLGQDMAIPVAGRPEDFSGMAGVYRIATSAEPRTVHVEDPITLVVKITGSGAVEHQPKRALLRLFPASMKDDFFVEPLPKMDRRLQQENAWQFAYRLRPKHESVTAIPGLKLVYYHPERGKFLTTYASQIELKVTPRPQAAPPEQVVEAVTAPPSFFELTAVASADRWRFDQPIILTVLLLMPPLLALAWRRWAHSNGVRVEHLRRSQAARRALHELAVVHDAARVSAVVSDYLRQRLEVPMTEPVPSEIERVLMRGGVSKPVRRRVVAFFRACDALRFAGNSQPDGFGNPSYEAVQLIQALEAEPCLR